MPEVTRDRDHRLAELLDAALADIRAGETVDSEAWRLRYPELADDLPVLLDTLKSVDTILDDWRTASARADTALVSHDTAMLPPPDSEPPVPDRIGRYRILERIGSGGMGAVYRAHDPELDRIVAVKVPRLDVGKTPQPAIRQRFVREARAAAAVRHPHVCPIYDVGECQLDEGPAVPFVVMAFVEGPSLADRLSVGRLENVGEAVALVRQAADGLAAVHDRGIIHRDLKPANILLSPRPFGARGVGDEGGCHALLTDFGLARPETDTEHLTSEGVLVGTPSYMAPEQAANDTEKLGPWTDIYSLGVVLYQMLTGRLPFEGPVLTVLTRAALEAPPSPCSLRPDLDPALEALVLKAMARKPADRFQSARELSEALHPFEADTVGKKVHAPEFETLTLSAPAPTQRKEASRRRMRLVTAIAAGLLFIVLGALAAQQIIIRISDDKGNTRDIPLKKGETAKIIEKDPELPPLPAGKSPLDRFQAKDIPASEKFAWQPKELVAVLGEHGGARHWELAVGVAFSPDGKKVASRGSDGLRVWDAASSKQLAHLGTDRLQPYGGVFAFSPDGRFIATRTGYETVLLDAATLGERIRLQTMTMAFAPDRRTLAYVAGTNNHWHDIVIWDLVTEKPVKELKGHKGTITRLAYSADGELLISGSDDQTAKLWDPASGIEVTSMPSPGSTVAIGPDGKTVVVGPGRDSFHLWDVAAGKPRATIAPSGAYGVSVAFAPDGESLATVPHVGRVSQGILHLWDAKSGALRTTIKHAGFSQVAYSPDGRWIATGGNSVLLWDAAIGAVRHTLPSHKGAARAAAYSTDGKLVVTGGEDGKVRLYPATGKEGLVLDASDIEIHCVAISPDKKSVLAGTRDGHLWSWDAASGKKQWAIQGHLSWVQSVAFSPKGDTIVSAGKDGTVRMWNSSDGKNTGSLNGHGGNAHAMAQSRDGKLIAIAYDDKSVRIFEVNGKELKVLEGHTGPVLSVAFDPDAKTLVSASEDGTARVWDIATGKELYQLKGHEGAVRCVAYAPDGPGAPGLATGGQDGTVRLWLAGHDLEWITLHGHTGPVWSVAFAPDGKTIASAGQDGKVLVRQTPTPVPGWEYPPKTAEVLAISPDGKLMVTRTWGGKCQLVEVASGQVRLLKAVANYTPDRFRFTPNGATLVIGGYDASASVEVFGVRTGTARRLEGAWGTHWPSTDGKIVAEANSGRVSVWDVETGRRRFEPVMIAGAWGARAPSSDGDKLFVFREQRPIAVHDASTGREVRTLNMPYSAVTPYYLCVAPDGKTLSHTDQNRTTQLWDVEADKEIAKLLEAARPTYAHDSKTFACSTASFDVVLVDVATGKPRHRLKGHTANVRDHAYSPDNHLLATWADDNRVILWNVADGKQLRSWTLPGVCTSVLFAPDGRHLLLNNSNGTAYVLRLAESR